MPLSPVDQHPSRTSLPSGSPVTERWRLVQKHLPPLAELLDVEIVIMNAEGYCVGGTGPTSAVSGSGCPRTMR